MFLRSGGWVGRNSTYLVSQEVPWCGAMRCDAMRCDAMQSYFGAACRVVAFPQSPTFQVFCSDGSGRKARPRKVSRSDRGNDVRRTECAVPLSLSLSLSLPWIRRTTAVATAVPLCPRLGTDSVWRSQSLKLTRTWRGVCAVRPPCDLCKLSFSAR